MGYQSLVSFEYWTFIAQLCNLFIQMYLFKRFLFKPVKNIIAKRQAEINAVYKEAEEANESAKKAKEDYEASIADSKKQADTIVSDAINSAKKRSDEIVAEAENEAAALRRKAEQDIALERQKALNSAKGEISEMAVELAEKLVEKQIDAKDQDALIGKFIDELGEE